MVRQLSSPTSSRQQEEHPVLLQGLGISQLQDKPNLTRQYDTPLILKRTDQDFIEAILAELESDLGIAALRGQIHPAMSQDLLTLLQPVHRTFYVTLLEVVCDRFNLPILQPRLDPDKIDSVGLVVRRLAVDDNNRVIYQANGQPQREGWRCQRYWDESQQEWKTRQNWIAFAADEETLDPDLTRHRSSITTGHPGLDRLLFPAHTALSESQSPLFVVPPDIGERTGRTILYGLVPVTSPDISEGPPEPAAPDPTLEPLAREAIAAMLPYYLRPGYLNADEQSNNTLTSAEQQQRREPNAKATLTAAHGDLLLNLNPITRDANGQPLKGMSLNLFISSLQQLRLNFNGFENPLLMQELNRITVAAGTASAQPLGNFLREAARILLDREAGQVTLPETWSAVNPQQHQTLVSLIQATLMDRLTELTAGEGRFEGIDRQYQFRAFLRVKCPNGCPPRLIWSEYSNPFTIAPWYADSGLPPVKVVLPDILDPKSLAKLKPNVAFSVPPKLFNFLNRNSPKDLMEGKGEEGEDNGLAWICSFNIPIITLCAYIVLNIFLQLFNLIFWWLPMIKICIPVPRNLFPKKQTP
jgi:hypothetical protein